MITSIRRRLALLPLIAVSTVLPAQLAGAASTDLSNEPLATRPTVQAKPNLMFILDNSGSMNWSYMPDDLGVSSNATDEAYLNWYGYYSPQCNGLAFDPNTTYAVPVDALGNEYGAISVTSAPPDGYVTSTSKKDLRDNYYYIYSGTETAMNWEYTSSGVKTDTNFYKECSAKINRDSYSTSDPGNTAGSNTKFTKVRVGDQAEAIQKNYANWYSYYRKRFLLMRTAMGRAVKSLDSSYRVGFTTINEGGNTNVRASEDGTNINFRDVKDFDATQKDKFYSSLYRAAPNGSTPLRAALSRVGSYYAKLASGQSYDPVQYSCQRNYALLSTDGYWNTGSGYDLAGSAVGNQDADEQRPMRDASTSSTVTTTVVYTSPRNAPATRVETTEQQTRTRTWTLKGTTTSSTPTVPSCTRRCSYLVTTTTQTYTQVQTQRFITSQEAVATYTKTSVSENGGTPVESTSSVTYGTWQNVNTTTEATDTGDPSDTSLYSTPPITSTSTSSTRGDGITRYATSGGSGNWLPATPRKTYTPIDNGDLSRYVASVPTRSTVSSGGSSNSLSDVAQYYYQTDLRQAARSNCTSDSSGSNQDVCDNIVRPTATDKAEWQHMNTFTIGLGVSGTLPYDRNYLTQTSGTYVDLKNGTLNWPNPASGEVTTVDDLWHAAVNGRGQYYSALNATLLSEAINGVINNVQAATGASSAAATSALELVAGDNNQVYQASYTTQAWTGDLLAFSLNGDSGQISTDPTWSAQAKLDAMTTTQRSIYFRGADGGLQSFTYDNLSSTQKAYFRDFCSQAQIPSQCAGLTANELAVANNGTDLVNFLRGHRTRETASTDTAGSALKALFRRREHVLGDIINGAPVHVGRPPFAYADSGYATFVSNNARRKPVVYVGANDGMLHAISAGASDGGTELWAYVPGQVMANMYKLADTSYASRHQYFVDGGPVMGDIQVSGVWKTILVGGFNYGGRGYYALDITDPENPVSLWEFSSANMGFSFGNPVITKRADGTWVVAFTSGYNNTGGDGRGHLYMLNAHTGELLLDIATTAGSSADPSGLAKINAWIDSPTDNTTKRFYGGDLHGNLWRFDIDNLVQPNRGALLLANFSVGGTPQPITTKPETIEVSGKPGVVVATGRYLGTTDISDSTRQSIYAVKDTMTSTGWGDVRSRTTDFVVQSFTLNAANTEASLTSLPVDWASKGGWYVDLPHDHERVATSMALQYNTLVVASAIPNGDACASGGASWLYYLDVTSGGVVQTNPSGMLWSANTLAVGMSWVKDTQGNVRLIIQNSDGRKRQVIPPTVPPSGLGSLRRTSWRELID